jgi:GNAT superfamily N-acetyltransferase
MSALSSFRCRLRAGSPGDAKAVLRIFADALVEHGFDYPFENVRRTPDIVDFGSGADPRRDDIVAMSGGRMCGFLILVQKGPGCGDLAKVFVAKTHRGQGIGTMLIEECIRRARARGYRRLVLETHADWIGACRYYERHGWRAGPDLPIAISPRRTYTLDLLSGLSLAIKSEHERASHVGSASACDERLSRAR